MSVQGAQRKQTQQSDILARSRHPFGWKGSNALPHQNDTRQKASAHTQRGGACARHAPAHTAQRPVQILPSTRRLQHTPMPATTALTATANQAAAWSAAAAAVRLLEGGVRISSAGCCCLCCCLVDDGGLDQQAGNGVGVNAAKQKGKTAQAGVSSRTCDHDRIRPSPQAASCTYT